MASQTAHSSSTNSAVKELISNDLALLCNTLNPVAPNCSSLGLQLGVQYPQIRTIENDYKRSNDRLREIISERLKQNSPLTWLEIVTALRAPTVGEYRLASQIEQEHLQPSTSSLSVREPLGGEPYPSLLGGPLGGESQRGPPHWGHYESSTLTGPPHEENYQPPTLMTGQTPVRGPQHENYQPPTLMTGQTPVRGPPHWENYQPPTLMTCQTPVRGPQHGENYQPPTLMTDQTPVRGPQHGENYQPPTLMTDQTPVRGPMHYQPPTQIMGWIPPTHGGNYQPPTHMMGQTPGRGPPHGENYQPHTLMMGQTTVREPLHGENYHPPTLTMGQTPVRGPPHWENYQQIIGWIPVRWPPHEENYQFHTPIRGPTDIGHNPLHSLAYEPQHRGAWGTPYTYISHTPYINPPHMLPPTIRPLQQGIVGGQWDSQSYVSHSQPQTSLTQSQRSYSLDLQSKSNSELPPTQGSSASHSVLSAHHRTHMDTFVHYIKVTYQQCEIEKNLNVLKWPPTPSKIFINLACIDWESVVSKEEADEYTRAMVEDGNVDVIMKKKTNIDFDDIARDLPTLTALEKVVLVEGAPGVGKSTFAWEFCRKWERGEIAQQYQLVLLLRLRDERMSRAKCLRDLIYHSSESVSHTVVEELESTFGVNTLIILEGFDELPDSQRKEPSIFLELILGQLLLHATIMITSRPWATGALLHKFKHRIFLHVEILGFTEENITKYVTSVCTGEVKKTASTTDKSVEGPDEVSEEAKKNIDDVMEYIGKYPQIKACMYIPLNAAIVVSIYRESMKSKWILPTTLTGLYYALTRILLRRHLCGHAKYQKYRVESFEDLPEEVYSQLLVVSKKAYDGVCKKGGKKIQLIFSDIPDDFETLGLMQSVSQLFMDGQKTSYNFLHLTFQEFLAAFLISTMSSAKQLEHFQRHNDGRLRVVLRFLAGLTKLKKVTPDQLKSLFEKPTVEQSAMHRSPYCNSMRPDVSVSVHHTNWLFEAQNSELLQLLFHNHTAGFTFTFGMLPLEYYSVGYCVAHSHSKWSLTFNFVQHTEETLPSIMLVRGAKTGDQHHSVALKTPSTYITSERMCIILNGFTPHIKKVHLSISDNGDSLSLPPLSTPHILELELYNNESAFNISCELSFSLLEALIICTSRKGITLGNKTCKAISKLLSSTTSLKALCLCSNKRGREYSPHVSDSDMEVITISLTNNTALPLKSVDIDCECTFTATATRSLVQLITKSTTLQCIRICHVTFSAQGLIELTEAIYHCFRLQEKMLKELLFHMQCSEDFVILRHMFKNHPDMQNSIDWNEITRIHKSTQKINEMNALTLSIALEYGHVTLLNLSNKRISDVESEALALGIRHSSTLKGMDLSNNSISDAGAVALTQALFQNSTLESLNLSNNNFREAVIAVAQALHHNSTLKDLDLSSNSISDAGAETLAQALHRNSVLKWLDLSDNDAIGKEGTHQLVKALTVNTSIVIYGLRLPRRCEEYATQCTQYNTVIKRILFL